MVQYFFFKVPVAKLELELKLCIKIRLMEIKLNKLMNKWLMIDLEIKIHFVFIMI